MADVNINAGVTESVRFEEQAGDVATPAAGYWKTYFKEGGLYWIDDAGIVAGPLGSSFIPSGRLTLTTGVPVTTADVTGATAVYYTPYNGDMISLYDGARWIPVGYTEKSLTMVGATASKPYDFFGYLSSGTLALEKLVWTDATTRATALAYQDGRLVKSGDATRLYLGTVYCNSSGGQTDDSVLKRNVFNYYNRKQRKLLKRDATSHSYTTASWRAWNNDATFRVEVMVGVQEDPLWMSVAGELDCNDANAIYVGLGLDITNNVTEYLYVDNQNSTVMRGGVSQSLFSGLGWHWIQVVQLGQTAGTFPDAMVAGYIMA